MRLVFPIRGGLLVAGVLATVPVVGCGGGAGPEWADGPVPKVVASFPPIYCFALNVAGDAAAVKTVMSGQGPHHFDPKPSDARLLRRADLFFVNGLGLDDRAAKKLQAGAGNQTLRLVALGDLIAKNDLLEGECHHDHGHGHHDHPPDPHVWLGVDHAATFVAGIRDGLKDADPAHAADYDRRAAEYAAKLQALKADGLARLKDKKDRKFVSFHESLNYFAKTFDREVAEVIEQVPGKEPTAKELKRIVEACVENKVRVIAVEPQYTGKGAAAAILRELTAKGVPDPVLVPIDPLETAAEADLNPGWYEDKMKANLDQLAKHLR